MAHIFRTLGLLLCLGATAFADVDKEELKKLVRAGLSDDLIIGYVRQKGPLVRLSADDVVELKNAGLSDVLLVSLLPHQAPAPKPASTDAATAKLLSDPDIVWDGRAFYPRSYFSSDHAAYCSPAIGAVVVNPGWYATAVIRCSRTVRWGPSFAVRTGFGGPRYCYR
jgi:hypothetical protein